MIKEFVRLGLFLLVCVIANPALAQTATPSDQPLDSAKVELGGEIFDLTSGKQDYTARLRSIGETLAKTVNVPAAGTQMADIGKIVENLRPALRQASAEAYARHFTLEELQTLKSFYASPVGTKIVQEQAAISHEVMLAVMPEMISDIRAHISKTDPQQTLQDAPQPVK
jgi:hypothetical protein